LNPEGFRDEFEPRSDVAMSTKYSIAPRARGPLSSTAPLVTVLVVAALACSSGADSRGHVGESCRARSDCDVGLVCIRNVCILDGLGLSATGKSCFLVECAENADCCANFVPDPNCGVYEAACNQNPTQCLSYFSLCQCNEACENERCVDRGAGCLIDDHCPFASEPHCVEGHCVACVEHGDCPGSNDRCVNGSCEAGCVDDEQCPLFYECTDSACVPSGCTSDRECIYLFSDARGVCRDARCALACRADFECDATQGEICVEGRCVFAGCTTDAECRVAFDAANEPTGVRAVCR